MGRFSRLRKNKKYGYTPRYYDDKGEGSPFKMEQRLDRFRSTGGVQGGIKSRLNRALRDSRQEGDPNYKLRFLLVLAILLLVVLYLLDFDLSIFFPE
ncbi:riboflavin synthase subunit beta [Robiginitalea sp. M366]|uniref:riboflavin synthase subunit beta n=1 Tax=Robiginitalea aestuariiviva TaxID=3036903 RepID=UPI00240D8434|nr:riboflavin synthase subunit beta [Robiginitalea aestuariiviva]MDG1573246.1 riboflavin synthase subunit beta [Robiginitalea aestuariiviva]